jgi:hypothetical protein
MAVRSGGVKPDAETAQAQLATDGLTADVRRLDEQHRSHQGYRHAHAEQSKPSPIRLKSCLAHSSVRSGELEYDMVTCGKQDEVASGGNLAAAALATSCKQGWQGRPAGPYGVARSQDRCWNH